MCIRDSSSSGLADAERAVRRLHTALTRAAAGTEAGTGADAGTADTGTDGCEGRSDI